MPHNPYYVSQHWRRLRALALLRDGYRCVTPGCGKPAVIVDHVVTRSAATIPTSMDVLSNLRSLCADCDRQTKELPGSRARRRGGRPMARGSDADGWPHSR